MHNKHESRRAVISFGEAQVWIKQTFECIKT